MQKVFLYASVAGLLFGNVVAMNKAESETIPINQITENCFYVETLRDFTPQQAKAFKGGTFRIEKHAHDILFAFSTCFQMLMNSNANYSFCLGHLERGQEFIDIPIGETAYLAAISKIFSSEPREVNERSLSNILFAAQSGCEDAKNAIKLACNDSSYESAIAKGEYRAKECLRSRILDIPYGLDFYQPIALDFSRVICSSSDWRIVFKHIFPNISFLEKGGDIEYAYAAIQDICCLYDVLKAQYVKYLDDVEFRNNLGSFLLVAARAFEKLEKKSLSSQFKQLSDSVYKKDPECINHAYELFSESAKIFGTYND